MTDTKDNNNDKIKSAGNKNDQNKKQTGIEQLFLIFMILFICVCIAFSISINSRHDSKTGATPGVRDSMKRNEQVTNDNHTALPTPPSICANLIYEDSTLSEFDLIDNEDITLWNTVIGEGSAEKPSFATKISIMPGDADIDSLFLRVSVHDSIILDTPVNLMNQNEDQRTVRIDNTGCIELTLSLFVHDSIILQKCIPFTCGE